MHLFIVTEIYENQIKAYIGRVTHEIASVSAACPRFRLTEAPLTPGTRPKCLPLLGQLPPNLSDSLLQRALTYQRKQFWETAG